MPDVIVACQECGAERTVSEYAAIDRLTCLVCRAPLEKPAAPTKSGGLGLRQPVDAKAPPVPLTGVAPPEDTSPLAIVEQASGGGLQSIDVHAGRAEESKNRAWIASVVFVLVAAVLVGLQWKFSALGAYQSYYLWGRIALAAGAYLMVALVAFQDSTGTGSMCLFLPPYTIMYAGSSVESHVLRGVFFAVLVAFCTEVYFIRDQALAMAMGNSINDIIRNVDNLIVRASM